MKRIILVFALVAFATATVFSQNSAGKKTTPAPGASKQVSTAKKEAAKDETLHYSYHNGRVTNCMGNKWNAQLEDVKLKNGTIVTRKGLIKYKNGTFGQLKEGECIDGSCHIEDHKEAHSAANEAKHDADNTKM
jgi:hypothetical protein